MAARTDAALAAGALLLALAGCAGTQQSQVLPELYEARMDGAQEVPAVATPGRGQARVEVDARGMLRWTVDYQGLSSPVTGAHVHGPAGPGQNAPALIPLQPMGADSFSGESRITPEQQNQLASGHWYLNLHTERHPQGEIRGQLRPRR